MAVAVAALGAVLVVAPSLAAEPLPAAENDFVAHIQSERASAALTGYSKAADLVADLVAVARAHAEDMADQNRLHHNSRLPDQVEDWDSLVRTLAGARASTTSTAPSWSRLRIGRRS